MTSELTALETSLWDTATRSDRSRMDKLLAPDAFEFGRSGRRYTRAELLAPEPEPIDAELHGLTVTRLSDALSLVTYQSEMRNCSGVLWSNRSSLRDRSFGHWQLRFHQGTPTEGPP